LNFLRSVLLIGDPSIPTLIRLLPAIAPAMCILAILHTVNRTNGVRLVIALNLLAILYFAVLAAWHWVSL
jgi:hypothetical protein